ncbi:hypothetical protein [Amycolatopsis decaplanina]|uniref:Uncharacterized protein n=1 Tax=Amycolatopsis decaplanina DSM 44594 TaxID=1284240 RepID=M2Z4H8_9PSEU|nr:hypothetical protein [Amycolatopsis decaplanina]EME62152.1 hypothetical protein H074_09465 [Amycolatopsis decaplanina DSM 44594]
MTIVCVTEFPSESIADNRKSTKRGEPKGAATTKACRRSPVDRALSSYPSASNRSIRNSRPRPHGEGGHVARSLLHGDQVSDEEREGARGPGTALSFGGCPGAAGADCAPVTPSTATPRLSDGRA